MQPLFQRGSPFTRLLLFILLSVSLMVADHRFHHLDDLRDLLAGTLAPLRYAVDLPSEALAWAGTNLASRGALVDRVDRLERINLRLRARQQQFETLRSENDRLRVLLDSSAKRDDRVLVSELLSVDLDPYRHQVVINHGRHEDAYRGQPLIDAHGVMGQLVQVGPFTATALLISDPNHALPVQINRNGLRTIASGTGEPDRLELLYIPNSADVRVGDLVVTSGLGGTFPANYPVATIEVVERRPGESFARVEARPEAQLDRSREVLLVWPDNAHTPAPKERQTAADESDDDAPAAEVRP
ncbi:MAG: rod shape-determining protein MreC [Halofilum sp. (in: g-proteobacteria)]